MKLLLVSQISKVAVVLFMQKSFHQRKKNNFIYDPDNDTRIGSSPSPSVCNPSVMLSSPVSMVPVTSGLHYTKEKKIHTRCIFSSLFVCALLYYLAYMSEIGYNNKLTSETWRKKHLYLAAICFKM